MYKVISNESVKRFTTLDEAMFHAKAIGTFVTISGGEYEIVGCFGVDSVVDGKCPDGITYDWNKASRIGRVRK